VGIGATHGRTWPAPEITDAGCRFLCALTRDFTRKHSFGHYSEGNMGKHCRPFLFFPATDHQIWGDFVEMTKQVDKSLLTMRQRVHLFPSPAGGRGAGVRVFANGSALACALMPRRPPTSPRAAPHDSACKPNRLRQHESMIRETLPSPRLREKGAKLATSFTMSKNFCLPA
jgi:hypothetical protein